MQEKLKITPNNLIHYTTVIKSGKRVKSLLLGRLDEMIQLIQRSTRAHRGVVNKAVGTAVADNLVKRYLVRKLGHMQFELALRLDIYLFVWNLHEEAQRLTKF